jgi:hypothetical protein
LSVRRDILDLRTVLCGTASIATVICGKKSDKNGCPKTAEKVGPTGFNSPRTEMHTGNNSLERAKCENFPANKPGGARSRGFSDFPSTL